MIAQASLGRGLTGPVGSETFGEDVLVLSNGNYVVVDSNFDTDTADNAGAVFLYDGATNELISTITGSSLEDHVGIGGVTEVGDATSAFVIVSPSWQGNTGAVTLVPGDVGLGASAVVDATNSLIGASADDAVGSGGVTVLASGDFVVDSPFWTSGTGAVTFVSATVGLADTVSDVNSLVGSTPDDHVGSNEFGDAGGVTALSDGDYVVASPSWDDGVTTNVGAVTFASGDGSAVGVVDASNSLVGTSADDNVGSDGVTALIGNGNYVVASSQWDDDVVTVDAGAVTWGDGTGATFGPVSAANSLIGSSFGDSVGVDNVDIESVTALTDGNYVVVSPGWDNVVAGTSDAGAATWSDGDAGTVVGAIDDTNSLVGLLDGDIVGSGGATALADGNYVVSSPRWNTDLVLEVGAVTWAPAFGLTGEVTTSNSLTGTTAADHVGGGTDDQGLGGVTALANGNYVVSSPMWDTLANFDVGAATLGDGTAGTTGEIDASNSLIGARDVDNVGIGGVTALINGNYVVSSPSWANGDANPFAGAATWGAGTTGVTGEVTAANSLVGGTLDDVIGSVDFGVPGITALANGDYVVASSGWDNGTIVDAGAVTRGNGATGIVGLVSAANSLVGSAEADLIGSSGVTAIGPSSYVVVSPGWNGGDGAATFGPAAGVKGPLTSSNSVFGSGPGAVLAPGALLTADGAAVIPTDQNQALLLREQNVFAGTPANITTQAAAGATSKVVTFANPAVTKVGTPVTCAPVSGTAFAVGTTVVNCDATDNTGYSQSTSFTVTVTPGPVVPPPPPVSGSSDFVAKAPARLADTRPGSTTVDGLFAGQGIRPNGSTLELTVANRGGVAADATAVALNVTAADALVDGFVTVYPCGSAQPTASNLNYTTGSIVPNAVIAKIGPAGTVCLFVSGSTHLIVDVTGYFPTTTTLHSINPARVLETRAGLPTVDGLQQGGGIRAGLTSTPVQITGRATVPAGASAVVLNVTVTEAQAPGFVTVYPCGTSIPTASSINYVTGSTVANLVVSKIAADGTVCIFTNAGTHLVADVNGYFPAGTLYRPLDPARLLDTRAGATTIDGQFLGAGPRPASTITELTVTNRGGVPVGAGTVVLNVTVTEPTLPGFVTVYPCGITPPLASNLNYVAGDTVANAVIVQVGPGGKVCLLNSAPTQLVADVNGYLPS